jgi:hypothetical protein
MEMGEKRIATEDELVEETEDVADGYAELVVHVYRLLTVEDEEPRVVRAGDRIALQTTDYTVVFNESGRRGWSLYRNNSVQPVDLTDEHDIETVDDVVDTIHGGVGDGR